VVSTDRSLRSLLDQRRSPFGIRRFGPD